MYAGVVGTVTYTPFLVCKEVHTVLQTTNLTTPLCNCTCTQHAYEYMLGEMLAYTIVT